jgi:hypothetical protein
MLTKSQRQQIESEYRVPIDARIILAKCAAGLLVIVFVCMASIGVSPENSRSTPMVVNASQASTGR